MPGMAECEDGKVVEGYSLLLQSPMRFVEQDDLAATDRRAPTGGVERILRRGGILAGGRAAVASPTVGGKGECASQNRRTFVGRPSPRRLWRTGRNHLGQPVIGRVGRSYA